MVDFGASPISDILRPQALYDPGPPKWLKQWTPSCLYSLSGDIEPLCWALLEVQDEVPLAQLEIPLMFCGLDVGADQGLFVASFDCFYQLGILFCGCPYNKSPTIWGSVIEIRAPDFWKLRLRAGPAFAPEGCLRGLEASCLHQAAPEPITWTSTVLDIPK